MPSERILIIEDDPDTGQMLEVIVGAEGYAVTRVTDGRAGLEAIRRLSPDLVVLDLLLPEMSGLEVCRRAREATLAPIIMLTGKTGSADRVLGLNVGADDYVAKPFEPGELLARIRAHLRRVGYTRRSGIRPAVELHGLRLDPSRYEATADGTLRPLTRLEFDLLYHLAAHPGEVFTRLQLIEAVWGPEEQIDPRGIDAHIRRLREKIEREPDRPTRILTVHGVGYKMAPLNATV